MFLTQLELALTVTMVILGVGSLIAQAQATESAADQLQKVKTESTKED